MPVAAFMPSMSVGPVSVTTRMQCRPRARSRAASSGLKTMSAAGRAGRNAEADRDRRGRARRPEPRVQQLRQPRRIDAAHRLARRPDPAATRSTAASSSRPRHLRRGRAESSRTGRPRPPPRQHSAGRPRHRAGDERRAPNRRAAGSGAPSAGAGPCAPVCASRVRNCSTSPSAIACTSTICARPRRAADRAAAAVGVEGLVDRLGQRPRRIDRVARLRGRGDARLAPASARHCARRAEVRTTSSGGLPSRPTSRNSVATQWVRSRTSFAARSACSASQAARVRTMVGTTGNAGVGDAVEPARLADQQACAGSADRFALPVAGAIANISCARSPALSSLPVTERPYARAAAVRPQQDLTCAGAEQHLHCYGKHGHISTLCSVRRADSAPASIAPSRSSNWRSRNTARRSMCATPSSTTNTWSTGLRDKGAVFVEELDEIPETGAPVVFSAHGVPKSVPAERKSAQHVLPRCHLPAGQQGARRGQPALRRGPRDRPHRPRRPRRGHRHHGPAARGRDHADRRPSPTPRRSSRAIPTRSPSSRRRRCRVDDTREIVDSAAPPLPGHRAAAQGRHLLRHHQPAGSGQARGARGRRDDRRRRARIRRNSVRLVEVAQRAGCTRCRCWSSAPTEIDWSRFEGIARLGVTAGASAPETLVDEVIEAFAAALRHHGRAPSGQQRESIVFNLPRELREPQSAA